MQNQPPCRRKDATALPLRNSALGLCLGAVLLLTVPALHAREPENPIPLRVDDYSDKYDEYFRHYSDRFFGPYVDWRWFKAQAVAESLLNPQAESIAGARGVMQLLPRTFAEVSLNHPNWNNIHTPRWNIAAGIYYNYVLYQQWNGSLHGDDRFMLTLASYNAGFKRVRYAYNRLDRVRAFDDLRSGLPAETRGYIERIRLLMSPKMADEVPVVATIK